MVSPIVKVNLKVSSLAAEAFIVAADTDAAAELPATVVFTADSFNPTLIRSAKSALESASDLVNDIPRPVIVG